MSMVSISLRQMKVSGAKLELRLVVIGECREESDILGYQMRMLEAGDREMFS